MPKVLSTIPDQVAEVGDTIKLKIPFSGKGDLKFTLKKDNKDVPESDKVKITEFDGFITIQLKGRIFMIYDVPSNLPILDVSPDVAGSFKLEIANESGSAVVPFKTKVIGTRQHLLRYIIFIVLQIRQESATDLL